MAAAHNLRIEWLGCIGFHEAWELQKQAAEAVAGGAPDTLLLLEHPPTVTLGRAARPQHVLIPPDELRRRGVEVVETDRGGDVTYHGPGQLVGYPILDLKRPPHTADLHRYLRRVEQVLIEACAAFGLQAERLPPHTGVWVGVASGRPVKIAQIGVKASRWITLHGFALNTGPGLAGFDLIVPCGISHLGVTSLSLQLDREVTVEEVAELLPAIFASAMGYRGPASPEESVSWNAGAGPP